MRAWDESEVEKVKERKMEKIMVGEVTGELIGKSHALLPLVQNSWQKVAMKGMLSR